MNKTLLITGGAGFIGLNFIEFLLKARPTWNLVCVDNLTYAANYSRFIELVAAAPNLSFHKADIADKGAMAKIFKLTVPDIVVNFAAESHVDNSITNPEAFTRTNILGTQVLLDLSREFSVSRFHQVSTDEVYGDTPLDSLDKFTEESPLKPSSPYAASKASADLLVLSYIKTFNLPATISRCSNNYGQYQHLEKLIPRLVQAAIADMPLPIYGAGTNIRDWIFVKDHCKGILTILETQAVGQIYNIGANEERTNLEIAGMICKQIQSNSSILHIEDRPGHDLRYAIDATKLRRLGWIPQASFETAFAETIQWYKTILLPPTQTTSQLELDA